MIVNALLVFVGTVLLAAMLIVGAMSLFVMIVARPGDRPVELHPRIAATIALGWAMLVGCEAGVLLLRVTPL